MELLKKIEKNIGLQYLIGISTILFISLICYSFFDVISYHVVALILLLAISILAMFLDIWPMIIVAVLSALIWNFLFIQPQSTFSISSPQDVLLFLMYFVITIMNAVFTSKIRKVESISRKRKEKEKTLKLYSTLLNSLSHELKTPISTIIGAVDTLKLNNKRLSPETIEILYSEIDIAGNRLDRQVGNLLNMSRLESDFIELQLDWYDINEIVNAVIKNNQSHSLEHIIIFEPKEDLPLFKIDGTLIEQIIHNLVHNALLYTPQKSKITIEITYIINELQIEVIDNGNGFPKEKLEKVFEKFYRLPNTASGGSGLGLSIVKGFTIAHNGKITLINNPNGGATFTIKIPAQTTFLNSYENE